MHSKKSDTVPGANIVGGGPKKLLYTLNTLRQLGLRNAAKALNSHNACKACGLGMGGQRGGMTNELGVAGGMALSDTVAFRGSLWFRHEGGYVDRCV